MTWEILEGDCREWMHDMAANSIDSIVTDPPYGLSFMGKGWDHGVPGREFWVEALRVAKPGAYLLAFGGTRTHHRLMAAIEDAGWEIRDTVMWVYGSGFPKSLDVSKAIDKEAGAEREIIGQKIRGDVQAGKTSGVTMAAAEANRNNVAIFGYGVEKITIPSTDAAKQWQGWGTALKPAWEPIILARKPLIGTVATNVQQHGTGGLNIDGCRVAVSDVDARDVGREITRNVRPEDGWDMNSAQAEPGVCVIKPEGRWPANLIHDGSEEVLACFPESKGQLATARNDGTVSTNQVWSKLNNVTTNPEPRNDIGSAARFFYCAKASKSNRDEGLDALPDRVLAMSNQAKAEQARGNLHDGEGGMNTGKVRKNNHPTVKPTALMRYLCRLITPPGGTVLDPFMGSGSTGKGALQEGFKFVGIEISPEYCDIAEARLAACQ